VTIRLFFSFIRDLFQVLPGKSREEWGRVNQLRPELPTVILISGFAATRRSLSIIRKRLQRDGFNVLVLAMDWQSLADGIRGLLPMALRLSTMILTIKKNKSLSRSPLYLVTHSAGGLVARYYIQILGGSHYVEGLITLGTPHRGTWVAGLGLFTHLLLKAKCLWEMMPCSGLIEQINKAPWPLGFPMLTVQSKGDYVSYASAGQMPERFFESGNALITKRVVTGLSHSELLRSKKTYAILVEELRTRLNLNASAQPPVDPEVQRII
jgi:pimeloyl-ACP methyl ester carboxylesterase